jgi:hypothetical protein
MTNSAVDERLRGGSLGIASDEARMREVRSDRWISYPRAEIILNQMERILAHPRNWRMPSLLVLGEAGIGKTQIDRKFARLHPPEIGRERGRTTMPVISMQMPPGVTQRILYLTLLETLGVRHGVGPSMFETKMQVLRLLRDLEVRVIVFDEIHNLLAGGFREQRKMLAELRYLSNELMLSFVCFGTHDAREAFAGDSQLARRFGLSELGAWELDMEFAALIATVLKSLPLRAPSTLSADALKAIIRLTRGNTARIFEMMGDLAVEAIRTGEEQITDRHVEHWRPSLFERTIVA